MDGSWTQSYLEYQSSSTLEREIADFQAKCRAVILSFEILLIAIIRIAIN